VTGGKAYDGHQFAELVEQDTEHLVPARIYARDRGYESGDNRYLLEILGLHSATRLNRYRTEKKDKSKQVWWDLLATPEYQAGQRERYKVERKYGEAKG